MTLLSDSKTIERSYNMVILAQRLIDILSVLSYLVPAYFFLPFRLTVRQTLGFFLLLLGNILLIRMLLGNSGAIVLLCTSSLYIAFLHKNRLLNICVFVATYLFCALLDNVFLTVIGSFTSAVDFLDRPLYTLAYISLYVILLALICPFIGRYVRLFIGKMQTITSRPLLILIAANLSICLFIFLFNIIIGESVGYTREIIAFNCTLFICHFILSTVFIVYLIKSHAAQMDLKMRQDSYNRLQEYTNQIENMYSSLRSFKHDYSNVMLSMSGYIEAGDMEGLRTYFNQEIIPLHKNLISNTARINQLMRIKTVELKSIISSKLLYAIELNISVSIEVMEEIPRLPVDPLDLTRVIGIFLDNAVEAALETENPRLRFAIINLDTEYLFIISNTFLDRGIPYAALRQPGISTKGSNRGLGLYNAGEIIGKYAHVFWDTETKDTLFIQRLHIAKQNA